MNQMLLKSLSGLLSSSGAQLLTAYWQMICLLCDWEHDVALLFFVGRTRRLLILLYRGLLLRSDEGPLVVVLCGRRN